MCLFWHVSESQVLKCVWMIKCVSAPASLRGNICRRASGATCPSGPQERTLQPGDLEEQLPQRTGPPPPSDTQPDHQMKAWRVRWECQRKSPLEVTRLHNRELVAAPNVVKHYDMKVTNVDLEWSSLFVKTSHYTAGNTLQTRRGQYSVSVHLPGRLCQFMNIYQSESATIRAK